jgi:hypothetical protein
MSVATDILLHAGSKSEYFNRKRISMLSNGAVKTSASIIQHATIEKVLEAMFLCGSC